MLIRIIIFFIFILSGGIIRSQTGWINISIGNSEYKGIVFPNRDTGYAFRNDGIVLKTLDKGNQWNTINTNTSGILLGSFTNALLGSLWSLPAKMTTDGGLNWNTMSNDMNSIGFGWTAGLVFINNTLGFAVGGDFYPLPNPCCYDGRINKTTNAGQNWIQVLREPGLQLEDIKFADENNIIVLASTGFLESTDGGNSWNLGTSLFSNIRYIHAKSMSDPFTDTFFVAGYITTGDTAVIAKTTNSGKTWSRSFTAPFKSRFRKLQFVDNNTGYAVGDTGLIVSTTNSGTNWIIHNSGTRKRLNGVAFINKDTGFVAGDSGLILKTFTGGLVEILQQQENIPARFILYQNYPNPFNPETKIKYDLPKNKFVNIKIYNMLGKEIKTIVNEYKTAGSYINSFNGSDLSSGIYYYKIKAGEFEQVRKMMLLK